MSTPTKIFAILLAAGALLAGIVGFYLYNKPHTDLNKQEPDIIISAADLYSAFEADEQAATTKYVSTGSKEIILQVTGTAQDVTKTEGGGMTLSLKEPGEMLGVNCEFQQSADVEEGETLTVRGICTGMLMDVVLARCILVQ